MKKLALFLWLLGTLALRAGTAPAFPSGLAGFVDAFTNTTGTVNVHFAAVADIFGNGQPALITANYSDATLSVLTNNGGGGFGLQATLPVGYGPTALVATNINGSGHIDLLCANQNSETVSVLTNNGSGTFTLSDTIPAQPGNQNTALAVADIYNNGKPAVILLNDTLGSFTVYTNAGGGSFGSNANYAIGGELNSITAADLNGDGRVDLVCANLYGSLTVLTNNGSGQFVTSDTLTLSPAGSEPVSVAVADIYHNGRPALIFSESAYAALIIYTNAGAGTFGYNTTVSLLAQPAWITAADVNGDGAVDLICDNASFTGGASALTVLTNNGSGTFTIAYTHGVAAVSQFVTAGNIFGDGKIDLATGGLDGLTVFSNTTAFYQRTFTVGNNTNLLVSASGSPAPAFSTTNALPPGVTLIDHGNGTATLAGTPVITSGGVYNISLTASNSSGIATQAVTLTVGQLPIFAGDTFAPASTELVGASPVSCTTADIYGTGAPAVAFTTGFGLAVFTNAGGGLFVSNAAYATPYLVFDLQAADVFGTGKPALAGFDLTGALLVFTNNGGGLYGTNAPLITSAQPVALVAADILGTGRPVWITGNNNNTLSVFTNNGSTFSLFATVNLPSTPNLLAAADLNGDGQVDLVTADYYNNLLTVLTNNGRGGFFTSQTIALVTNYHPVTLTIADIYNNGRPAVVTSSSPFADLTVFTNAGGGLLGSNTTYQVYASFVQAADINNDGHIDLITANDEGELLTILTNNGAGQFAKTYVDNGVDLTTTLVAADLNGDGRVDLISGNDINTGRLTVYTNGSMATVSLVESTPVPAGLPAAASGWPAPAVSQTGGTLPAGVTFANGFLTGTPNPGTAGTYTVYLTETNALGASTEPVVITVTPVIIAPPYALYTDEGIEATLATNTLLASDSDRDQYPLSLTAVSSTSAHGAVVVWNQNLGDIFYFPPRNYTGSDTFTYTLLDTAGDTVSGTVAVTVLPPPAPETCYPPVDENTPRQITSFTMLFDDFGVFNHFPVSVTAVSPTSTQGGTVTFNPVTGNATYTPVTGYTGPDQFTYAIMDTDGGTNRSTAYLTVYPPPVTVPLTVSTVKNTPLLIPGASVLANDSDPAGQFFGATNFSLVTTVGSTITLAQPGNPNLPPDVTYTPATNFTGLDTLTYTLYDALGGTTPGLVQIIVTAPGSPAYNLVALTAASGNRGQLTLQYTGLPRTTYYLQTAPAVTGPWTDALAPSTDANSLIAFPISTSPSTPAQYYRVSVNP